MFKLLVAIILLICLPVFASDCPRNFEGQYIWLDELNGKNGPESFFHNALEITLELNSTCDEIHVVWQHQENFTLEWTNSLGDFKLVPDEQDEMFQKLILAQEEIIEIVQRTQAANTTTTTYQMIGSDILKVEMETRLWGEEKTENQTYIFVRK